MTVSSEPTFLERLVAEKGPQFANPEELAKSKIAADEHIKKLEAENAELRNKRDLDAYRADVTNKLAETNKAPAQDPDAAPVVPPAAVVPAPVKVDPPAVDQGSIDAAVAKALEARTSADNATKNVSSVTTALTTRYGEKSNEILVAKLAELGMSEGTFKSLAQETPAAAMSLLGLKAAAPSGAKPNIGTVTAPAVNPAQGFNKANYTPEANRLRMQQALQSRA